MVSRSAVWVLFAVFTAVWFSTLEYRKLVKPDEGRYAEIAREMAVSGDWVTPRLNGIKYFEKPPLQYWTTAAAFKAFGQSEWTARLWSGLTGFCGVLLAFFAGRRLYGELAGLLAATVLGTSLLYFIIGHLNTLDMGLAFFLEAALVGFLFAQASPPGSRQERRWMLLVWAAMALAVLSKGLIGIALPVLALVAYSLVQRDLAPWQRLQLATGVPLFLVLTAPWFIAVSLANPEFPRFFFLHEHFQRFLTTSHRRTQPPWYFGPILLAGLLPWTTVALQGLAQAWNRPGPGPLHAGRFLLLWTGVIFAFFSLSGSKLPSYILPVVPAAAILAGDALARMPARWLRRHLVLVGLFALGALSWFRWGDFAGDPATAAMIARYAQWLMVAASALAAGSLLAWWSARRERPVRGALILGVSALFLCAVSLQGHQELGRSNSAHYIAEEIRHRLPPGAPFYSVGMYDQTLPFYLRRTLTLVDYEDEFAFGLSQEPQRRIPTMEDFNKRWREDPEAFAVMTGETYRALQAGGLPMHLLARDTRRVIVAKP